MKKLKIRILMYRYKPIFRFRNMPKYWSSKHYNNIKTYSDIIKEKYF